jgi:hypothetical protein
MRQTRQQRSFPKKVTARRVQLTRSWQLGGGYLGIIEWPLDRAVLSSLQPPGFPARPDSGRFKVTKPCVSCVLRDLKPAVRVELQQARRLA